MKEYIDERVEMALVEHRIVLEKFSD